MTKLIKVLAFFLLLTPLNVFAQYLTKYPDIPRIDVHAHPHQFSTDESAPITTWANIQTVKNYLAMSDVLRDINHINLAMWISLGGDKDIDSIDIASKHRVMTCISDFSPQREIGRAHV